MDANEKKEDEVCLRGIRDALHMTLAENDRLYRRVADKIRIEMPALAQALLRIAEAHLEALKLLEGLTPKPPPDN